MAFYPREWLDELRERSNIVEIVGEHVRLKRAGVNFVGLCPFHGEKTPSFNVSEERQMYRCFGCGASGDVIRFLTDYLRLDFTEAVQRLADRARMPVPETGDAPIGPNRQEKERMSEALTEAARYFFARLYAPEGKTALSYLNGRGLDDSVIRRFGLGASGTDWTDLRDTLAGKGFTDQEMASVGLVSTKGDRAFDLFRQRAMFPIFDRFGKVVAFGGRILGDGNPKYLNSPETPVFHKRSTLYGLNFIKGKQKRIYLVEGYMDVVSLYRHGVKNCVATLGTALTAEQAKMMGRAAEEIVIVYDGDNAGQRATEKALDIFREAELSGKVMVIPGGADPDDFVRENGGEAFFNLPLMDAAAYRLSRVKRDLDLATREGRSKYAIEAAAVLRDVPNIVEIDGYLDELSKDTGFSKDILYEQIGRSPKRRVRVESSAHTSSQKRDTTGNEPDFVKAQQELLSILAGGQRPPGTEDLTIESFTDPLCRRLAEAILSSPGDGRAASRILGETEDEGERAKIGAILSLEARESPDNQLTRIAHYRRTLHYHTLETQYEQLQTKLKEPGFIPSIEFIQELKTLQKKMHDSKPMPMKE